MTAPKFITLTNATTGRREVVTTGHIVRRWPEGSGTIIAYPDSLIVLYAETPEQIDALLGVTADPMRDAAPAVWQSIAALNSDMINDGNFYLLTDGRTVLTGCISRNDWGDLYFPTSDLESIAATHWMPLPALPAISSATGTEG